MDDESDPGFEFDKEKINLCLVVDINKRVNPKFGFGFV